MDVQPLPGSDLGVVNDTEVPLVDIAQAPDVQDLVRQVSSWVNRTRSYGTGQQFNGSIFDRQLFLPSENPYEKIRAARTAAREDDVVSGALDITEGVAFKGGMHWESSQPETADLFNQLAADLELDKIIRQMWAEDFVTDQVVIAKLWDWRTYRVRGTTRAGNARKRKFRVYTPVRLVVLNSAQVVPVGWSPLRGDRLAWQATDFEIGEYDRVTSGAGSDPDPLMERLYVGKYVPASPLERGQLGRWGVQMDRLLEFRPEWVFRHAPRRPDYQHFPDMGLESAFVDLDLKRQLMLRDRATLVGGANYILLIRKGSREQPATKEELRNLRNGYHMLARIPVIIADHRLTIDIITPKQDFVLQAEPYAVLDDRILARMLRSFVAPSKTGSGSQTGGAASFMELAASSIESRRHMLKRTLEKELARAIVQHPFNAGMDLGPPPSLAFKPGGITVGTNQAALAALLALRTQNEISRETILQVLDLDQAVEAQARVYEADTYDDIFATQVPYTAAGGDQDGAARTPNGTSEAPEVSGARGGRPPGGGSSPDSPGSTARPRTRNGNPSTGRK